ncbi:MAG: hypothetical protein J0I65_18510 [Variovorax sp.]|nr:hypothetical protein [Variovorax sp.]
MNPIKHPSNTRMLAAPPGWDEDLKVEPLGITDQIVEGVPCVWSFWRPDVEELAALNAGGDVVLSIVGRNMPPAALMVTVLHDKRCAAALNQSGRCNCGANGQPVAGGHESLEDALSIVESFGPGTEGLNDTFARQILLAAEVRRLQALINSPQTVDWFSATDLEAAHQVERWGTDHDAGKNPEDWFWLLGYLSGKALAAFRKGDREKGLHHIVSSAATLLNWHRQVTGISSRMRPGVDEPKP